METARIGQPTPKVGGPLAKQTVLRRVLRTDPAQEYLVYVPRLDSRDAPLCVLVHGISRNPRDLVKRFAPYAEALGVVLVAPHFAKEQHPDYQRLGFQGRGARSDLALNAIIEEVMWLTGVVTQQIHLFGHSGGAQFAHRYLMAYPSRVARAVIVSAGWYTFPNARDRFPYGIRPTSRLRGVRFDPEEFLRVPTTVFVGSEDTTTAGMRRTKRADAQGVTRVERARNWVASMRAAADAYRFHPLVSLREIDGGSHSFKSLAADHQLGGRAFEALFGGPSAPAPNGGNGNP